MPQRRVGQGLPRMGVGPQCWLCESPQSVRRASMWGRGGALAAGGWLQAEDSLNNKYIKANGTQISDCGRRQLTVRCCCC